MATGSVSVMPQAWTTLEAVPFLETPDHALRSRRAPDGHASYVGEVIGLRVFVKRLQHGQKDRRHPGGEGHPLLLVILQQALGVEVLTGHHLLGPDHGGGERHPPGVDVEHRHHRQDYVPLPYPKPSAAARANECRQTLRCEYRAPFGLPVVPDV